MPSPLPRSSSRTAPTSLPAGVVVLTTVVATLLATLLVSPVASAASTSPPTARAVRAGHPVRARAHSAPKTVKSKPAKPPVVPGQPRANYVIPATSFFSFPNRSAAERLAIRNRVLRTIQSTWGGRRTPRGLARRGNGTIRITTWSFADWGVARALVAARNRGVSVQVVAATSANTDHRPWKWLVRHLGRRLYQPGAPQTRDLTSFARECRGACRGPGGTPHAKYFLFDNVGAAHARNIVVQTSMNLTDMAYSGQWNQAQVVHGRRVYDDFLTVFRQARIGRPVGTPYRVTSLGRIADYFFPRPGATAATDPVMQILGRTGCRGATGGGTRADRTRIRIVQYALYGDRGLWIAKRLRFLWGRGCDLKIIYTVSSRAVLSVLESRSGRGPIPMRQSLVRDAYGNIVQYNHSKWMTITGRWAGSPASYLVFSGSANWANLAFGDDEQMQRILGRSVVLRYLTTFAKTWHQRSSSPAPVPRALAMGRVVGSAPWDVSGSGGDPQFGQRTYRYLPED